MFAGTEGDLPPLIASSKFIISEGFATATTTYRHQETQVPDSNSVALVTANGVRSLKPAKAFPGVRVYRGALRRAVSRAGGCSPQQAKVLRSEWEARTASAEGRQVPGRKVLC